mgnify:CR=1 FL=1
MKKITSCVILIIILLGSAYVYLRYSKNREQIKPYPYVYRNIDIPEYDTEAPILIIGDRQATRLASFSKYLAQMVSLNLSKPIKVTSIAQKGEGIHRTLEKIKRLPKLPLIILYLGGNEEYYESIFHTKDIKRITTNLKKFSDPVTKSLIMIFPAISRFLYKPVDYKVLDKEITKDTNTYTDTTIQKRNIILFELYKEHLRELLDFTKDHGSFLVAITQPLNLDSVPRKSCTGSFPANLNDKYLEVVKLIKQKDYKAAYSISKKLVIMASNNAKILYLHGKVAKNLNKIKEAKKFLKLSSAYDCSLWRGNIVYNSILRQVARDKETALFDFQKLIESEWTQNITFIDDVYPQSIYFERLSKGLAARIKKLLRL